MPPRQAFTHLGAALGTSLLLHAGALGSLGFLIGGASGSHPEARPVGGLRATLNPLPAGDAGPGAARDAAATVAALPPARVASELAAPGALAVFEGPRYFTAAELDQRPAPVSAIDIEYPDTGRPREGYLMARILIDEQGRADKVQVLVSDPEGAFDRLVIEAFAGARYRPGTKDSLPVKSQMIVEVRFQPENSPGETPQEPPPVPQPAEPR